MTREDVEAAFAKAYECSIEELDPPMIEITLELVRQHNDELQVIVGAFEAIVPKGKHGKYCPSVMIEHIRKAKP